MTIQRVNGFLFKAVMHCLVAPLLLLGHAHGQVAQITHPTVDVVIPIFSQVVKLPVNVGFVPAYQKTQGNFYIWEAVPPGESVQKWTQMITVSGLKGAGNQAPEAVARMIAEGFKRACPDTFSVNTMGIEQLQGNKAFALLIACGIASPVGEPYSEMLSLIAMQGRNDLYTLQWAERGPPSKLPIQFDARWVERIRSLAQVKLCDRVLGEQPPYPSCTDRY